MGSDPPEFLPDGTLGLLPQRISGKVAVFLQIFCRLPIEVPANAWRIGQ